MSDQDDDLDSELRRLFEDERLTVRPREDATATILAGARRIRRRRAAVTATGGVLTALVLVFGGLAVGLPRSAPTDTAAPAVRPPLSLSASTPSPAPASSTLPPGPPPAVSASNGEVSPSTTETSAEKQAPSSAAPPSASRSYSLPLILGPTLGPTGYGKLQLGMSFATAKQTGLLVGTDTPPSGCGQYLLAEGSSGVRSVTISGSKGIVRFDASGAHTPERIKIGSSKSDLMAAYPSLAGSSGGYQAPAGSGANYLFTLDGRGQVASLALAAPSNC